MKILRPVLPGVVLFMSFLTGSAQPDSAKIKERAIFFADSLIKADTYQSWPVYADLAPTSVVKHYGGKEGYIEHIKAGRKRTLSTIDEDPPELKLVQLMTVDGQWQCLIRESRYFHKDDKKFHVITYFLGQSMDEGETWRLFDISFNAVANIIYIFPEVFGDMAIPEASILSEEEELAKQKAASTPAGKKTGVRKK